MLTFMVLCFSAAAAAYILKDHSQFSLGPFSLGDEFDRKAAILHLGPVIYESPQEDETILVKFKKVYISIVKGTSGYIISAVTSETPSLKTKAGLKVGDSFDKMKKIYGKPVISEKGTNFTEYLYVSDPEKELSDAGIKIRVSSNKITSIYIFISQ